MSIYRNFCREVVDENGKLLSFSAARTISISHMM